MVKDLPVHPREVAPEIACSVGSRYLDSVNHHWVALQAMQGKDKLEAAGALDSAPSCMDSPSLCSATRLEDAVQTNAVPHTARSDVGSQAVGSSNENHGWFSPDFSGPGLGPSASEGAFTHGGAADPQPVLATTELKILSSP